MGYESTTDRYIPEDDNPGQALLSAEFAQQTLREANEQGDAMPEDKAKLEFQDKQIVLLERLARTADAEEQDEIRRQLRELEAEYPEVMATAFAILPVNLERQPQKGVFKGYAKGHAGQIQAAFTSWSDGREIYFRREGLIKQLESFRQQGKPIEELEKALANWPEEE